MKPYLIVLALLACAVAQAQTPTAQIGLAMIANAPAGIAPFQAAQAAAKGYTRQYSRPVAGQYVLACNPATDATCKPSPQPNWSTDAGYQFQQWPVPVTYLVMICNKALTPNMAFGPNITDLCTAGEDDTNKPLILAALVQSP